MSPDHDHEEGMIDDAGLFDGPCPNCSSLDHKRLSFTERECWGCFTVFVAPQPIESAAKATPSDLIQRRIQAVIAYFQEHIRAKDFADLACVNKEAWFDEPGVEFDPTETYAVFGYLPPRLEAGLWEWTYCPEIMAEQTASMTDIEFDFYLSSTEVRIAMWWVHPELSPAERERQTDDLLHTGAPGPSKVVDAMQLRVLDARQAERTNRNGKA